MWSLNSVLFYFILFLKRFSCSVIDVDDILSVDFMPSALLMLESPENGTNSFNKTLSSLENSVLTKSDGSFDNAMHTMNFHRFKIY